MDAGTWRIGRVAGADVLVGPSLLLMGALLILVFAPRFGYLGATLFVLGIYSSVFVHELAHLTAARAYGMGVRSITLHLVGGETAIATPSRTPAQEFVIAVIGPLTSIALGLAGLSLNGGHAVVAGLGWINVVVGVFNLLPGLPLDGGRALRALIWRVSGHPDAGTRLAGWAGRFIAVALVVAALLRLDVQNPTWSVDLALAVFVAWFLWEGAGSALQECSR